MKKVVVILPTLNEKENIAALIDKILAQEEKLKDFNFEVLISDGSSTDGTAEIVKKLEKINPKVHYLNVKKRGVGIAIVEGTRFAIETLGAKILVTMDADFSHNPADLPKLLAPFWQKDFDLVIGSRFVPGGKNRLGFFRQMLSFGACTLMRFFTGFWQVREWTTAFRAISVDLWQKINFDRIPWKKKSFVFQPAFLYYAVKTGAKFKEVPIVFQERKAGTTKISTLNYIFDTLLFGFEIFLRRRSTFVKFLIVGTFGFIVNTTALFLLYDTQVLPLPAKFTSWQIFAITHPDARLFIASVLAVETSIISNFLWHENWTFRWRPKRGFMLFRFARFNVVAILSPVIQVATVNILTPFFGIYYLISNAIGVLLGLTWNWIWNSRVIWRG